MKDDKVINYCRNYVNDKSQHCSEPMLTYKDLEHILDIIDNLRIQNMVLMSVNRCYRSTIKHSITYLNLQLRNNCLDKYEINELIKIFSEVGDFSEK